MSRPLVIAILDGFGIASTYDGNVVAQAKMSNLEVITAAGVATELNASGAAVGLLDGEAGNSEAGHMNLGAGRVVEQQVRRITSDIQNGTFFKNEALHVAAKHAQENGGRLHLMGLLSTAESPHSNPEHLAALRKFCNEQHIAHVFLHFFTDGRDSSPTAGAKFVRDLSASLQPNERIVTVMGRSYAMDRKKDWKRIKLAYAALVNGEGRHEADAVQAVEDAYKDGETDEFIEPTIIGDDNKEGRINDGDAVIFFNFRPDRARELSKAFIEPNFEQKDEGAFTVHCFEKLCFVTLVDYGPSLSAARFCYPEIVVAETLPVVLSKFRQLYVAESEKFAHVTYFFNGGHPGAVAGEEQRRILSPDVVRYAEKPSMAASEITDVVIEAITKDTADVIVFNFANADMLGHTGNIEAAVQGIEEIDSCLGQIDSALSKTSGYLVVTADHGNVEKMLADDGTPMTKHTDSLVPFIVRAYGETVLPGTALKSGGALSDVAPTILKLLATPPSSLMTGKSLWADQS
ncbi:2,3-bisphosphoglycerate-independent phosphoglycerate mutase [Candidatus Uhrbacteria bacterium CG10_big_fil_rev_8_21_14_0_10_48_11]|uniref:2,3-bisphosphoglycerate-independent phosphoglycerate mutase n=1 Tax=Candidatus Uhrbacteria bacterium CG10_big_fil_rev_8_21_14_0_10_48_11 TaxID=1975037 RepID=A0A2M8LDW9_9BACT|nr:MAG: 2,3-bisphosphoglycerate-independent phosphoglycerate mutase [Candidatus Uhrbacteria bacterium CG10_big_fil_rev_8_21_14_0_10_48_11]